MIQFWSSNVDWSTIKESLDLYVFSKSIMYLIRQELVFLAPLTISCFKSSFNFFSSLFHYVVWCMINTNSSFFLAQLKSIIFIVLLFGSSCYIFEGLLLNPVQHFFPDLSDGSNNYQSLCFCRGEHQLHMYALQCIWRQQRRWKRLAIRVFDTRVLFLFKPKSLLKWNGTLHNCQTVIDS